MRSRRGCAFGAGVMACVAPARWPLWRMVAVLQLGSCHQLKDRGDNYSKPSSNPPPPPAFGLAVVCWWWKNEGKTQVGM